VSWCVFYTVAAVALGVYFIGGAGVDQNVFFDAYIALALSTAVVLRAAGARLGGYGRSGLLACYLAPLVVSALVQFQPAWLTPAYWLEPNAEASRAFAESIAFVRDRPGPATCEEQACYWAGKAPAVDYFNFGQHVATSRLDENMLLSRIDERSYGVVQLSRVPPADSGLARALRAAYANARRDAWGVYFVPR
jgi:hypothetical protein